LNTRAKVGSGPTTFISIWGHSRSLPVGTPIQYREWHNREWGRWQTGIIWREPLPNGLVFVEKV